MSGGQGPFTGISVLEDAKLVAGPFCAKLLADLGARVVKVEPITGDPARKVGPPIQGDGNTAGGPLFLFCNTNKASVTLNVEKPTGRQLYRELLRRADVLVCDRRLDELERLGLTPDEVLAWNPSIVFVSITPYGLTGPDADRPGHELDVFHSAGEGKLLPGGLSYELFPDRQPVKAGRWLADLDAGIAAAIAVAAALFRRERTGRGDFIEVSHREAEMSVARVTNGVQVNGGMRWTRADRGYDFGGIFPCRDGYFTLRPNEDRHWQRLADALDIPGLKDDPRFATRAARHNHGGELNAIIREWAKDKTVHEVYERLAPSGAPVGFFADAAAVLSARQLRARGYFVPVELDGRRLDLPTAPYRFSKTPWQLRRVPPACGQDNAEVYGSLGLSPDDLANLRQAGVI